MTKPMEKELTLIWTVLSTKESGERINNMVRELSNGLIKPDTRDSMRTVKNMAKVPSTGQIIQCTRADFLTIIFMEREFTLGLMVDVMKGTGRIIRWTAMVSLHGPTEGSM